MTDKSLITDDSQYRTATRKRRERELKLQGEYEMLAIDTIEVSGTGRPYNATDVSALVGSIRAIGLQVPITVDGNSDTGEVIYRLVAGRHRLEAYRVLGHDTIPARVVTLDEVDRHLWTISENLHRTDLTPLERAEHIAEWIRLTKAKADASQVGTHEKAGQKPGGVNAAARELGVSKSAAHRAVRVAGITPEAKKAAVEAGLKAQADLEKLASYADRDQVEAVEKIAAEKAMARLGIVSLADARHKREEAARKAEATATEYALDDAVTALPPPQRPALAAVEPANGAPVDQVFDAFLALGPEQQRQFYALIIGAFVPPTPPVAVAHDERQAPPNSEVLTVQRKLLESELLVALDTATVANPKFGLTYEGWTASRILLVIGHATATIPVGSGEGPADGAR
jgi:ParB/RepB/Spo0J family partition protein